MLRHNMYFTLCLATDRRWLDDKIIGASAASLGKALLFQGQGADYLGVDALFLTATKRGTKKFGL